MRTSENQVLRFWSIEYKWKNPHPINWWTIQCLLCIHWINFTLINWVAKDISFIQLIEKWSKLPQNQVLKILINRVYNWKYLIQLIEKWSKPFENLSHNVHINFTFVFFVGQYFGQTSSEFGRMTFVLWVIGRVENTVKEG